jgi:predicted nucleic acid-binding protein
MNCLLDTTVIVDVLNNYGPALQWKNTVAHVQPGITSVTWLEIVYGTRNHVEQTRTMKRLAQYSMVYVTQADQDWAMQHYPRFHLSHGIDVPDVLIAAPSYRLQLPLYTRNLKHFAPLLGDLAQQPY